MTCTNRTSICLLTLATVAVGCGGTLDSAGEEGRHQERQGRLLLRQDTGRTVCDATLHFARAEALYAQSSRPELAQRGEALRNRWAPRCEQFMNHFWSTYTGCDTPMAPRAVDTFHYWDQARAAAFHQYGIAGAANAIIVGRARWQATCPADFQAATAQEEQLRAQVPLPVPLAAVAVATGGAPAETDQAAPSGGDPAAARQHLLAAAVHVRDGQCQEALASLEAGRQVAATPSVLFNIAFCQEQLGQRPEAAAIYTQLASDPLYGPFAQVRAAALGGTLPTQTEESMAQARVEFEQGLALAQGGELTSAILSFQRSYAAVPHPRTVMNIAVSHHRIGHAEAAMSYYLVVVNDPSLDEEMRRGARGAIDELLAAAGSAPATEY